MGLFNKILHAGEGKKLKSLETLPPEVEQKVRLIEGVSSSKVNLVWEPAWGKHLLSEAARLQLGMD